MPPEITDTTATTENTQQSAALEAEAKAKAKAETKAAEKAKAEEAAKAAALAEQEAAAKLQAEEDEKAAAAKLQADAEEEARKAAEEEPIDMSIDGQIARAQADLNEAVDTQNQVNRLVAEKTKALDVLITEKSKSETGGAISDIQFYLQREARKRAERVEKRNQLIGGGNALELIKQLDTRAPIDQRPATRKIDPRAIQPAKTTVNV